MMVFASLKEMRYLGCCSQRQKGQTCLKGGDSTIAKDTTGPEYKAAILRVSVCGGKRAAQHPPHPQRHNTCRTYARRCGSASLSSSCNRRPWCTYSWLADYTVMQDRRCTGRDVRSWPADYRLLQIRLCTGRYVRRVDWLADHTVMQARRCTGHDVRSWLTIEWCRLGELWYT